MVERLRHGNHLAWELFRRFIDDQAAIHNRGLDGRLRLGGRRFVEQNGQCPDSAFQDE
jgi:hypothetical protein